MKSNGFSKKIGLSCLANPAIFMGLIAVLTPIFTLYLPLSLAVILPVGAVLLQVPRLIMLLLLSLILIMIVVEPVVAALV